MKKKKLLILALCALMAVSAVGCGKGDTTSSDTSDQTEAADTSKDGDSKKSSEDKDKEKKKDKSKDEAKPEENYDYETTDELMSAVDEFNNTNDPDRKAEIGEEIQKFIDQVEAQSENQD